ncbi:hypothetical protein F5Y11DRAFT_367046 [Daldinia sp. FL1419]|nr:hypothetical protein F5Y11DRAFT_367046 [Daldinia sp. FL1419]
MRFTTYLTTLIAALVTSVSGVCLKQPPSPIWSPGGTYPMPIDIAETRPNQLTFIIPANSTGPCQLVANFPYGYPMTSTGSDLVYVTALNGPAEGSLVGALRFRPDSTTVFVNSFACRSMMAYSLSIAQGAGEVSFGQTRDAGMFMEVGDCY